ncbi:MAG: hypothetical protein D4R65_01935 [Verrucomicrobiaceae bacterium]|nr:MAG: hypothetical protein D4R65_01935 [Verrucomicrobiaceae bacterium]
MRSSSGLRPFAIFTGIVVVLAVAAFVALSLWFGSFIRSAEFQSLVARETGEAFGSRAEFAPLRWNGASAFAESASLQGTPSSALMRLSANQIRAEVNWRAVFSGAWRVEEITVTQLDGEWQNPSHPVSPVVAQPPPARPTGLASILPQRFELGILKVGNARLRYGATEISNCAVNAKPDGAGWIFEGTGGRLQTPWTPELNIVDFRAREQGGDLFLTKGNLALGSNGKISLSGESSAGGNLRITWEGVSSADVLKGEWARRLSGTLSGNAQFAAPDVFKGTVILQDGRLENIPMLATVADFTQNPAFRRMPIQEMRGDFVRERGDWRISNFFAESKGLLRIEGSAVIGHNGSLKGQFQIGVTAQTLQWLPGSREAVFKIARDGYLWTDLTVGGTIEKPKENLSERLATAMGTEVIERSTELIKKAPGTAVEGVKGVLDILRPLVP